jgi:hypothetical protein
MNKYVMIKILEQQQNTQGLWDCVLEGEQGRIRILDLVWITDRQDLLAIYYWESWAVTQGAYHCCFSVPGKVTLLPPQQPGS